MAKDIPLRNGARVTHVSDKSCVVGVIVHANSNGTWDVHWFLPPWISERDSRGTYTSKEIKRTYIKEKEVKKLMMERYKWNMSDAFQVESE